MKLPRLASFGAHLRVPARIAEWAVGVLPAALIRPRPQSGPAHGSRGAAGHCARTAPDSPIRVVSACDNNNNGQTN